MNWKFYLRNLECKEGTHSFPLCGMHASCPHRLKSSFTFYLGEIFIWKFDLPGDGQALAHVTKNVPCAVFGTWVNDSYFISSDFLCSFQDNNAVSELWLNYIGDDPCIADNLQLLRSEEVNANNFIPIHHVLIARDPNLMKDSSNLVYLIYTTGHICFHQHQVYVHVLNFNDQSLAKIGNREANFSFSDKYCIETDAKIIGMTVSSDQRSILLNCRALLGEKDKHRGCHSCPGFSSSIELRIYSLCNRQLLKVFTGHQAFSQKHLSFFIFLNSSTNDLVAR